jgi:hypothetical protein
MHRVIYNLSSADGFILVQNVQHCVVFTMIYNTKICKGAEKCVEDALIKCWTPSITQLGPAIQSFQ